MGVADNSILDSTKQMLGLESDNTDFDLDIITYINSTFFSLNQLGIGPLEGYMIEGKDEKWVDYLLGDVNLNAVRAYMVVKVRSMFDPPSTSFSIAANDKIIAEHEWRLNIKHENDTYVPIEIPIEEGIL